MAAVTDITDDGKATRYRCLEIYSDASAPSDGPPVATADDIGKFSMHMIINADTITSTYRCTRG